jgi:MFS transporter, DHA1 family, multidrug resistance protein
MSQPPALAAGLSVHPRIAGAASGLLGFLQMTIAALGTLLIGRLPHDSAMAMVVVVASSLALALVFGLLALRRPGAAAHLAPSARLSPEVAKRSVTSPQP